MDQPPSMSTPQRHSPDWDDHLASAHRETRSKAKHDMPAEPSADTPVRETSLTEEIEKLKTSLWNVTNLHAHEINVLKKELQGVKEENKALRNEVEALRDEMKRSNDDKADKDFDDFVDKNVGDLVREISRDAGVEEGGERSSREEFVWCGTETHTPPADEQSAPQAEKVPQLAIIPYQPPKMLFQLPETPIPQVPSKITRVKTKERKAAAKDDDYYWSDPLKKGKRKAVTAKRYERKKKQQVV